MKYFLEERHFEYKKGLLDTHSFHVISVINFKKYANRQKIELNKIQLSHCLFYK